MKKEISLFSTVLLLFISIQSFAQIRYGVKAGLNLATFGINVVLKQNAQQETNPSFHIGITVERSFSESFYLESGLLLSGKGGKLVITEQYTGFTYTQTKTDSPLYLEAYSNALYKIDIGSSKLLLFAGPYFGYGIAGTMKKKNEAFNVSPTLTVLLPPDESKDIQFGTTAGSDYTSDDFGLNIGAGIELNNIQFRLQYGLGLSNIAPPPGFPNIKNRVIGISIGYMFGGG